MHEKLKGKRQFFIYRDKKNCMDKIMSQKLTVDGYEWMGNTHFKGEFVKCHKEKKNSAVK